MEFAYLAKRIIYLVVAHELVLSLSNVWAVLDTSRRNVGATTLFNMY